jgi:hypothetical protein
MARVLIVGNESGSEADLNRLLRQAMAGATWDDDEQEDGEEWRGPETLDVEVPTSGPIKADWDAAWNTWELLGAGRGAAVIVVDLTPYVAPNPLVLNTTYWRPVVVGPELDAAIAAETAWHRAREAARPWDDASAVRQLLHECVLPLGSDGSPLVVVCGDAAVPDDVREELGPRLIHVPTAEYRAWNGQLPSAIHDAMRAAFARNGRPNVLERLGVRVFRTELAVSLEVGRAGCVAAMDAYAAVRRAVERQS